MKQNKLFSVVIALCMIALFTISWKPFSPQSSFKPVNITATFNGGTFPNLTGSFTTSGFLHITGSAAMQVTPLASGGITCVMVLTTASGTITINQQCQPPHGTWQIASGTGRFGNVTGSGSLFMMHDEEMTGFINVANEK